MVRVNAAAMKTPWIMRKTVKVARSGARASRDVGIASNIRLTQIPRLRLRCRLMRATPRHETAMPMVLAFTAKPMAEGATSYTFAREGRIAWVANKSTSVRKPIMPITADRHTAIRSGDIGLACASEAADDAWVM